MRDVELIDVEPVPGAPSHGRPPDARPTHGRPADDLAADEAPPDEALPDEAPPGHPRARPRRRPPDRPPVTEISLDGTPPDVVHHPPQHRATGGHRRRLVVLLVVGVLVAGGALVADRLGGGGERVQAVPPGMLARIEQPPWQRWSAPVETGDVLVPVGDVLVVTAVRLGRFTVTGLDATDGSTRWTQDLGPVAGARPLTGCRAADGPTGEGAASTIPQDEPAQAAGTVLLCAVEGPRTLERRGASAVGAPGTGWPTTDLLVTALAADTGEPMGEWRHRGRLLDVARAGDDLVLLSADHQGVARVERRSGASGEVRWWYEDDAPLRLRAGAAARPQLQVSDTFVLVQSWSVLVLAAEDGEVVLRPPRDSVVVGALEGELVSTWTPGVGGVVRDAAGEQVFRTRVLFPPLVVSDAAASDVMVLDEGGSIVARSLPEGEEIWRLDTFRSVRIVAGGSVVLLGVDGYEVVDLATGQVRWELPFRDLMWWAPLTDGTLVLGPGRTASGDPTIEARRLSDGEVAWTVPLEPGTRTVTAAGGHLLLRSRDALTALG
jgi:outer membrane protein assembly factor BamB